ncbi:hypothetical protein [Sphaerimonospora thailandensis]|uniref:Uncharacterized protein n=1 Tax=Sphaerimonospora thailandensis TaxID=795644 RepID=A0A8J3R8A7_9ACTN|nr:hypothetical protein [Sphaerimonospora thailandensis]GIH70313.1 hypothetical protein Mth01_25660 [Sphaerimonospora thailandensis]
MSSHCWDGGCWVVLDHDCEPVSGYHHASEANAHAAALPVGFYVRRVVCMCNQPFPASTAEGTP